MTNANTRYTALITGASSGIGLELAKCFAGHGFDLVLTARTQKALEKVADDCRQQWGVNAVVIAKDLGQPAAPREIFDELKNKNITVDALVNNAGFGTHGRFDKIDFDLEINMLQVNVIALTALTKLFVDGMIARRRGWILNVSSTAAFQAGPLMAVYFATKAFVQSFSEAIAVELAEFDIKVTALCPGPTPTGFQKRAGFGETNILRNRKRDVAKVARAGFNALMAGKLLIVPGLQNKLLADATRFAPRKWGAKVAKKFNE